MSKKSKRMFAVCLDSSDYLASLEAGKLYEVIPDANAAKHGLIRVIDESGEDYGYSADRFIVLDYGTGRRTKGMVFRIQRTCAGTPEWRAGLTFPRFTPGNFVLRRRQGVFKHARIARVFAGGRAAGASLGKRGLT